jgi:hypothetical protein
VSLGTSSKPRSNRSSSAKVTPSLANRPPCTTNTLCDSTQASGRWAKKRWNALNRAGWCAGYLCCTSEKNVNIWLMSDGWFGVGVGLGATQYSTAQHSTAQHNRAQRNTSDHITAHHIAPHHITSHHITTMSERLPPHPPHSSTRLPLAS